jgi:pimeloyl-ACP methyl ester carboxylesterase
MLLESRAPWEYAASLAALPWLNRLPAGDGHPVIVLPGLGASDTSTAPLRRFLGLRGYTPYGWNQGRNGGPKAGVIAGCREQLRELAERHGTKVSLIGWSLGGLYARELAKQLEAQTRCVITLGSPFSGDPRANNATRVYESLSGRRARTDPAHLARLRLAPRVPTTSIYSKTDGVVAWQCSLNDDEPHTENVEIQSSHIGMGVNPAALWVIADRLRQDPANWQRFDARAARWALLGAAFGKRAAAR